MTKIAKKSDETVRFERAQTRYLQGCAPNSVTRSVEWSGGATQIIECGDGPPLLLVHGGGGAAFHWGPVLSALAKTNRVLAVDRPGHGLADPFDYRGVDVFAHAHRFLADVLDAERLPSVRIAANSMGGLFALAFALGSPDRVTHLSLVGLPVGVKRALPLPLRLPTFPIVGPLARFIVKHPTPLSVRRFWRLAMIAHPERLTDDFLEAELASQARAGRSWLSLIDRMIDVGGVKEEFMLGRRWESLSVPTTFVMGDSDRIGHAAEVEPLTTRNARLRLMVVRDAGHVPWIDQPESVVNAIRRAPANT